jgi:adenosylhomocysteine nucleosidase
LNPPPLITFAVRAEAAPTWRLFKHHNLAAQFLLTGIGSQFAGQRLGHYLTHSHPSLVLSCGFAGALRSNLPVGALVTHLDPFFPLARQIIATGAIPVIFLSTNRVLATGRDKAAARSQSGADAVEMESAVIRQLCHERGIPSATLRVISDTADENLPFDFNRFLGPSGQIRYQCLVIELLRAPAQVRSLIRFQRQIGMAAKALAAGLRAVFSD